MKTEWKWKPCKNEDKKEMKSQCIKLPRLENIAQRFVSSTVKIWPKKWKKWNWQFSQLYLFSANATTAKTSVVWPDIWKLKWLFQCFLYLVQIFEIAILCSIILSFGGSTNFLMFFNAIAKTYDVNVNCIKHGIIVHSCC